MYQKQNERIDVSEISVQIDLKIKLLIFIYSLTKNVFCRADVIHPIDREG